jgi:hypothetical protein
VLLLENRFPIKADPYPQGRSISGILFITGYEKVSMAGRFTVKDENKGILFTSGVFIPVFSPRGNPEYSFQFLEHPDSSFQFLRINRRYI